MFDSIVEEAICYFLFSRRDEYHPFSVDDSKIAGFTGEEIRLEISKSLGQEVNEEILFDVLQVLMYDKNRVRYGEMNVHYHPHYKPTVGVGGWIQEPYYDIPIDFRHTYFKLTDQGLVTLEEYASISKGVIGRITDWVMTRLKNI